MADATATVNLTIDGKPVAVPTGTLLIEAAKQVGSEVPSFCYYPGLALQGACRMCLVSIEKMPKLQTACTTIVSNGMVVNTQHPEAVNGRKAMLEFLLTNHPLDCPVCDKGGECELQDAVFRYGAAETRFIETKQHQDELKFSSLVYYDRPRCILCYRCIRVCDEGMDVNAYGIGFRGSHSEIIPNHGEHLECEECGMCVDICPVGALTSGTYRYKTRPWELTYTGTICNHCGDGCKTTLSVRNNEIIRANNRDHSGFNGEFLCAKGRFGWDFVNSERRLTAPLVRHNGKQEASSWEDALDLTTARLQDVLEKHGPGSVAVIGSNRTTNEENYLLQRLARTILKTNHVDHHRTGDFSTLVSSLSEAGASDRYASMEDVARASSVLLIGNDPTQQHPLLAYQIRQAVRQNNARLYVVNRSEVKLALRQAAVFAKVGVGEEAAAVRELAGDGGSAEITTLRDKIAKESDTVVIFGDEIQGEAVRELVRWGLGLPGHTRFIALGDYANSRGAADMGVLPGSLPGYQPVGSSEWRSRYEAVWEMPLAAQPGRNLREIFDAIESGAIQALLVVGSNPVKTFQLPRELLGRLSLLVVAELFPTETTEFADVVLPAATFAEKAGTVTNTCGQAQAIKKTMRKAGTRSDFEIIVALARGLGHSWPYRSSEDVLREIITHVPGYAIALPSLLVGRAVMTRPQGAPPALERPDLVFSSHDTLFTSGTVSRFSWALNSVDEAKRPHGHIF
ncbi:MAG TPA: NADH-quinone oxidoreductase subunit NuoG [Terriglobia bacterium]|nr:NADH-quinone oxidoreductase subunit NuoG [Terriglobia bacterium]